MSSGPTRRADLRFLAGEDSTVGVLVVTEGAIASAAHGWSVSSSAGTPIGTSGAIAKASAGRVKSVRGSNIGLTDGFYLCVANATSIVDTVTVVLDAIWVPPRLAANPEVRSDGEMNFGPSGMVMSTGIAIAASSTRDVITLLASDDLHYAVEWI